MPDLGSVAPPPPRPWLAAPIVGPWGAMEDGPEAPARLAALNAALARHGSATVALERWCRTHGAPPGARIVAQRLHGAAEAPTADQRRRLGVGPTEPVRHRRVRLTCAGRVLSEADNWYVPGRLTRGMNRLLERTETPFGRAVQGLRFRRRVLAVELLWAPGQARPPAHVLRHRALLVRADGAPLSEVVETYTRAALFLPGEGA